MRILHSAKLVFVSKPRCGSTSIRRLLTEAMQPGDLAVDVPNTELGLHPHITASAIHEYLEKGGYDPADYFTFTVTRNPLDMLWSYFKYFQPDHYDRYNYNTDHSPNKLKKFNTWLQSGKVGLGQSWADHVPKYVSPNNLTPLSLEAHIRDSGNEKCVNSWYQIEHVEELLPFLEERLGKRLVVPHTNHSTGAGMPRVFNQSLLRVREQFPLESKVYNI